MNLPKKDIIAQLQRDILPLQGFKPPPGGHVIDVGLGSIAAAFPNAAFPTGAVHEFIYAGAEAAAASGGFIAGVLGKLMETTRVCIWISSSRRLFPPALKSFGIDPARIIFVDLHREKDIAWAMEEALKCDGLAAVVAEMTELSFTASRRLQLAVEQSRVTGFILRPHPLNLGTIACVARWKITPLASTVEEGLPGVGLPRWHVELLKIRNGKPGAWEMEWSAGAFHLAPELITVIPQEERRKIG